MPQLYTCSAGHQWESTDGLTTPFLCPTCGDKPSSVADVAGNTSDAARDALPPRPGPSIPVIPGYEILGELGRGGMGVVYKARQINLQRVVALKMILTGGDAGPAETARFRAEAVAVARMQHPHIVQIFEVGENQGRLFFSLEYMDGGGLNQKLGRRPQPPREAAALVETLARAMHHAHQRGLVHRDLKPANVLLTADGAPKIADFGLAKYLDASGHTAIGAVLGTASYMAPEQAQGQNNQVGPPADIWALGAILYEMLTGRPPFRGDNLHSTLAQVLTAEPPPPRQLSPEVPPSLQAICLRCLRKDPAHRYPSAAALADDLQRFLAGQSAAPTPARRFPLFVWGAAAVGSLALLLLVLVVGWRTFWNRPEGVRNPDGPGTPDQLHGKPSPIAFDSGKAPQWETFQIAAGSDEVFDRIAFPSRSVGYAASRSRLYKTADGGQTWEPVGAARNAHPVYVLHFEDEQKGWMSTDRLYHTNDGGALWSPAELPPSAVVRSLALGPNGRALAAGMEGDDLVLFRRAGADAAWIKVDPDSGGYWGGAGTDKPFRHWFPGSVTASDGDAALLGLFEGSGDEGALLRTSDGGAHWTAVESGQPPGEEIYNVQFADADHVWISGGSGALWPLDKNGAHGGVRPNPAGASVSRLAFDPHGSGFGLAPTWKGSVLLTRDLKAWELIKVPLEYSTPDAVVVDAGWAIVLGSDGKIARYSDPTKPESK
jgi:serine/threonine protein kinase/photosystem II stability/assembly factor-like uncharacterized protein